MLLHCNVLYCVPWLNCYSQPRHDLWRGFTVTNAMLRHSPTKGWKCTAKDLTSRNWWFHIWILGLAKMIKSSLRLDSSHRGSCCLFSSLLFPSSGVPLRADCYSMYYSLGQGRISNCQECRLSSALTSPATSHAIFWKGLGRTTLHFSRQTSKIFHHLAGCMGLSDQMLEKALMRPPSAPWGQRGSWWADETL